VFYDPRKVTTGRHPYRSGRNKLNTNRNKFDPIARKLEQISRRDLQVGKSKRGTPLVGINPGKKMNSR
jgi:hypothetical protein